MAEAKSSPPPFTYETRSHNYLEGIPVKIHILKTNNIILRELVTEESIDGLLNSQIDGCKKLRNLTSNAARLVNQAYKAYTNLHDSSWKDGFAPLNAPPGSFYDNFKKTYSRLTRAKTEVVAKYSESYEYEVLSTTQDNILIMAEDLNTGEFVATILAKNDGINLDKWGPYDIYQSSNPSFSVEHFWSINSFAANSDYPGIGSILFGICIGNLKEAGATSIVLEVYYVDKCVDQDSDCIEYSRDKYQSDGANRLISTGNILIEFYKRQKFVKIGNPKRIPSTLLNWNIQKMMLSEGSKGGNRASRRRKKNIIKSKKIRKVTSKYNGKKNNKFNKQSVI